MSQEPHKLGQDRRSPAFVRIGAIYYGGNYMNPSTQMPSKIYPTTGTCVFCLNAYGPVKLTDEHIVPFALSGSYILKGGSCTSCNSFASKTYEQKALNTNFLVPRLLLELKRRRAKTKAQKKFPMGTRDPSSVMNAKAVYDIELTLANYPKLLKTLVVDRPGRLGGPNTGSDLQRHRIDVISIGNTSRQAPIGVREPFVHTQYGKSIVKMAYCFAVGELGVDGFDGADIRDLLNGKRHDLYNFFGSETLKGIESDALHDLSLHEEAGYLVVRVALFSSYRAPAFLVALCPVVSSNQSRPSTKNPDRENT